MNPKNNITILLSFLLSTIAPILLGLLIAAAYPEWRWSHYPFHSMVESFGAYSAITIATLTIIMVRNDHMHKRFIIVALALISMGVLDGFHAVLHVGTSFVWLHSLATLMGGLIFALVWLPENWLNRSRYTFLISFTAVASLVMGLLSIVFPDLLPVMVENGEFTFAAKFSNIVGGLGFLVGSAYFVFDYARTRIKDNGDTETQDIVFANHCLLFGVAALLFEFSILWDAGWWWWHILRLLAYFVVLIYMFSQFQLTQKKLTEYAFNLELGTKELLKAKDEAELERDKATEANKEKSRFLANMSHELRTPMHAIMSFSDLASKRVNDEKVLNFLGNIKTSGKRLTSLINNLLDLSKLEAGKMILNASEEDMTNLVNEAIHELHSLSEEKAITVLFSQESLVVGRFDNNLITQVVINLISNAIKYSPQQGIIKIELTTGSKMLRGIQQDVIEFSIKDQGVGIPTAELDTVFDKFVQSSNTETKAGGTGLGLPICKEIIKIHKGIIWVQKPIVDEELNEYELWTGSEFRFVIPVLQK